MTVMCNELPTPPRDARELLASARQAGYWAAYLRACLAAQAPAQAAYAAREAAHHGRRVLAAVEAARRLAAGNGGRP